MISKAIELTLLSAFMGAASYGVGCLPFRMNFDNSKLNKVSRLSVGMLISTCLVIAIPEGIEAIYDVAHVNVYDESLTLYTGVPIFAGFFSMYVLDNLETVLTFFNKLTLNGQFDESDTSSVVKLLLSIFKSTLSLGLVIHAAVDGIALGSSFHEDSTSLRLIFFFVIIVHKLPTAFSLPTLLLREDVPATVAKTHMFFFSMMTPMFSLLSYVLLLAIGANDYFIGMLLVFSGGLFLYVVAQLGSKSHSHDLPQIGTDTDLSNDNKANFIWTVLGMAIPLIIAPFNY